MVSVFLPRAPMVGPELCVEGSVDPIEEIADNLGCNECESGAPWQALHEVLDVPRGARHSPFCQGRLHSSGGAYA